METNMNLVSDLYERIVALTDRAKAVIANSQKQHGQFQSLSDSQRLFCAFLSAQAENLLSHCATKIGVKLDEDYPSGVEEAASKYFRESASFLGTQSCMTTVGYTNAVTVLVQSAEDLITRAEAVLTGQGSMVSD